MKKQINIHIGDYHASRDPVVIHTILGSCVAVCLFDPENCIGGMNHILLPGKADMKHYNESARYGINAMELLIYRIVKLAGNRQQLVAKVFGGANVISAISGNNAVGEKNVSFAFEFLQVEGIRILNHDVGGVDTRKIFFYTDTADVFVKRVTATYQTHLAQEETVILNRMQKEVDTAGEVTLFCE